MIHIEISICVKATIILVLAWCRPATEGTALLQNRDCVDTPSGLLTPNSKLLVTLGGK